MPLLKGRPVLLSKPPTSVGKKDTIYIIPHTNEQFLSKEEYDKKMSLYNDEVWACQCTGAIKLTHKDAYESELKVRQNLKENFPSVFEKTVVEIVHHNTCVLESLVDQASKKLHEMLVVGETVTLTVTAHGKVIRGTIAKIDTTSTSDKSLNTSNDENKSPKKIKLLACKYGVKLDAEDKIINSIPVDDLLRKTRVPNKELIKLFIRSHAIRSGSHPNSPWVVDDSLVKKYSLHSKYADFLVSPNKMAEVRQGQDNKKKRKRMSSPGGVSNSKDTKKPKLETKPEATSNKKSFTKSDVKQSKLSLSPTKPVSGTSKTGSTKTIEISLSDKMISFDNSSKRKTDVSTKGSTPKKSEPTSSKNLTPSKLNSGRKSEPNSPAKKLTPSKHSSASKLTVKNGKLSPTKKLQKLCKKESPSKKKKVPTATLR